MKTDMPGPTLMIPAEAELSGTTRTFDQETWNTWESHVEKDGFSPLVLVEKALRLFTIQNLILMRMSCCWAWKPIAGSGWNYLNMSNRFAMIPLRLARMVPPRRDRSGVVAGRLPELYIKSLLNKRNRR